MAEPISLPPGVSLGIIAFLLSLLPAGLFVWLTYLRRHDRPVPWQVVALAFVAGLLLVIPAFRLEGLAGELWQAWFPATAHYFISPILPLASVGDVFWPAVGTFLMVAAVEEGLRYILLFLWIRKSRLIDQVFDGLVLGIVVGLGFATAENTLYFFDLFQQGTLDTLVFVFMLRFLVSTIAHICFGGLMGALIAQGAFSLFAARLRYVQAFFIPWFLHGLYDLLLSIDRSVYAVLILLPALAVIVSWMQRREFLALQRKDGHLLAAAEWPLDRRVQAISQWLKRFESPWNAQAPWLHERAVRQALLRTIELHEQ